MDPFAEFLRRLVDEGRVVFRQKPAVGESDDEALAVLERAFEVARLDVAGPAIAFDAKIALAAAVLVRRACWALVNRQERPEELARSLAMPHQPTTPEHHLSADLLLRYLVQVHRRAQRLDPADALTAATGRVLRQWPLSGVLADMDEGPDQAPDLAGHPGLSLLYAERLARNVRPAWQPRGRAVEYVELVARDSVGQGSGSADG